MPRATRAGFTELLLSIGDDTRGRAAAQEAFEVAYAELRRLAAGLLRGERSDHTLQPTELVHEIYGRLVDPKRVCPESRAHFFGIAVNAMRQLLVQHARRRNAQKRGGDWTRLTVTDAYDLIPGPEVDVLELNDLLGRLEALDPRMARIVELRVFAGLTAEETAQALRISRRTVQKEWGVARMWLRREMSGA